MNIQEKLKGTQTNFDEDFLFELSISLLAEDISLTETGGSIVSPYTIYSTLEDAVFDARSETESQERASFLELLEIMLWATYKSWKPLVENRISEKAKVIEGLCLGKDAIIKEFRENLSCKEGAVLRGYLKI